MNKWTKDELNDMEKEMDEAKKVIALPLDEKLKVVNELLESSWSFVKISDNKDGDYRKKLATLDDLYIKTVKPHSIDLSA